MIKFVFYSVILHSILGSNSALDIERDGWIPLTQHEVLNKFSRGFTRRSTIDTQSYSPTYSYRWDPNSKTVRDEAIKVVTPVNKVQIGTENAGYINPQKGMDHIDAEECNKRDCHLHKNESQKNYNIANEESEPTKSSMTNINTRQPKAILNFGLINNVTKIDHIITRKRNAEGLVQKDEKDISAEENRNSYKVTEDIIDTLNAEHGTKERTGYFYKPPTLQPNNPMKYNITDTFIDILSKYNIKLDDELPNYALSRRNKVQNPKHYMLIPIPLRNQPRFNNLNHLAVDPLVAVYLSNYGYYLPGLFGIQSKYRNLYGYLASNNIHNNKPFGSYKIYSDTDSSN